MKGVTAKPITGFVRKWRNKRARKIPNVEEGTVGVPSSRAEVD